MQFPSCAVSEVSASAPPLPPSQQTSGVGLPEGRSSTSVVSFKDPPTDVEEVIYQGDVDSSVVASETKSNISNTSIKSNSSRKSALKAVPEDEGRITNQKTASV